MDTRICKVCGKTELETKWVTHKGTNNGRLCLACKIVQNKAYIAVKGEAYKLANRKASVKYHNARRLNDPEWQIQRSLANSIYSKQKYANDAAYRAAEIRRGLLKAKRNPAQYAKLTAKRRAIKLCATPNWLSALDTHVISNFYALAALLTHETGILHHVDHIIPLQGKTVCGLHVPWNLQVLTAVENISKGNQHADI